ncbi:MAG: hypothetical protein ACRC10_07665 [Thermoguttaceae bacterium]
MVNLDGFYSAFAHAETDIKYAELSVSRLSSDEDEACVTQNSPRGVVVPAINELRYAAKHLATAMQLGSEGDDYDEQIRRATRHCIRARLDALKATVLFYAQHRYSFDEDYRLVILPDEKRKELNDYREKMQQVLLLLSEDHADSTDAECDRLRTCIEELRGYYNDLENNRNWFNQLLLAEEIKRLKNSSTTQWKLGIIIGVVVSVVVSVVTYVLSK